MDYENLYRLKFGEGISTIELEKRYPRDIKKISRIALTPFSDTKLKCLVTDKRELLKIIDLKKTFSV